MKTKIYCIIITVLLVLSVTANVMAKTAPPPPPPTGDYNIILQEYELLVFQCHDGRDLDIRTDGRNPMIGMAECVYYGTGH